MAGRRLVMVVPILVGLAGCSFNGDGKPQVLGPAAFYDAQPAPGEVPVRPQVDQGGAIVHNPAVLEEPAPQPPAPVARVSPLVDSAIESARAEEASAIIPATQPIALPSGTTAQYLTAGAVVVKVGQTPIYADKVIRLLTPMLSQDAKDLEIRAYQLKAQREIGRQVNQMIRDELLYATAIQNLTPQEIEFAKAVTRDWRKRQVTAAGGSEEQARARARAEGIDFDEKVNDEYRVNVWRVYYHKKIDPLVSVTAQDMRDYYTTHIADFTEHDQVQFRLIKITADATGGREPAIDKIGGIRNRMLNASAEEFAREAGEVNDDRGLKLSGGRIGSNDGWLGRGAFAVKEVEDAVWALQPGQVSEVVEVNNAFYVARLEDRKVGRVRSFDDQQVQKEIDTRLRQPQVDARLKQLEQRLLREAVISPAQPVLEPVLEMAMQKYYDWRVK